MSAQWDRHGRLAPVLANRTPAPKPEVGRWHGRVNPNLDRFADVFALFLKGARTAPQLREALEPCGQDQPYAYIMAMRRAGLLYVAEERAKVSEAGKPCGGHVKVYALQPYPFLLPDAPAPRGAS